MKQTETGPDPRAVRGKLPIGIQTVRTLREEGYRYADKTACVRRLVDEGRHYLLSRPRRFGKSFLVDTIEELFEGSEPLFRGLAVHDRGDWSTPHPVLRLDFGGGSHGEPDLVHKEAVRAGRFPSPPAFGSLRLGLRERLPPRRRGAAGFGRIALHVLTAIVLYLALSPCSGSARGWVPCGGRPASPSGSGSLPPGSGGPDGAGAANAGHPHPPPARDPGAVADPERGDAP